MNPTRQHNEANFLSWLGPWCKYLHGWLQIAFCNENHYNNVLEHLNIKEDMDFQE
jgi:hypothetical protein